jgi:hypothetical protein
MKYKTAVEWLEDNLMLNPFSEKDFTNNVKIFKKAKKMEKQQMRECYENVFFTDSGSELKFEQYYKETYENK